MSSQTKLIKDIMSTYESILENKNVFEAVDIYDNVDFKNIGQGNPIFDKINTSLLQDVQTAAKTAGVRVDITTAVSGHEKLPSRHPDGNAVDIAKINGKSVSLSNRADADKFVDALVSMGYSKNVGETGNPKVVLTFGFEGHDDHVHVSNTTSSTSKPTTDKSTDSSNQSSDSQKVENNMKTSEENVVDFIADIAKKAFGLDETKNHSIDCNYDDNANKHSKLLRKSYRDFKKNLFEVEPKNKIQENIDRIKSLL